MYIEREEWKEDKRKGDTETESTGRSRGEERRGKSGFVMQLKYLVFMYARAPVPYDSRHIFKYPNSEPYPTE
jgi:hypothetical protein